MRILVLNWQDHENPHAGGAELHLREIFRRIVARGHSVDLLCSSWENAAQRVNLDGIDVHRVGTRHTYPFVARGYYTAHLAQNDYDVVIEDLNKVPLYTPLWGVRRLVALVHHLFGSTVFREAPLPMREVVRGGAPPRAAGSRGLEARAHRAPPADSRRAVLRPAIRRRDRSASL